MNPRKIVCIHMNQVGDLLFSLPALHNLRAHFPEAHIASVVRPSCKSLLALSGLVDEIIERPRGGLAADVRIARRIRSGSFDLLVLFSTSFATWAMAQVSGVRHKAGFTGSMHGLLLQTRAPWTPPPSMQNNLRLTEAIGCPMVKRDYTGLITPSKTDKEQAEAILRSVGIGPEGRFAVLAPGSSTGREVKCWSGEKFAEVADIMSDKFALRSVVVGLGGSRIPSESAIDLTGKTSLPVLAAVLAQSKVFIGIDSGAMHLAAAMGTPVVGLFGPSDPAVTGPQGEGHTVIGVNEPCAPCLSSRCNLDRRCMEGITPEMVVSAAARILTNG
ncbi:MAG: glycosyltransferase family 9 protein [Armatimonadota bacterium]